MARSDQSATAKAQSLWSRIPDLYKVATTIVGAIALLFVGFRMYDDLIDKDETLDGRLQRVERAVAEEMLRAEDLGNYVVNVRLQRESCIQSLRAEMHEYRALANAYDELLEAMHLAEKAYAGRDFVPGSPDERQYISIVERRSAIQSKQRDVEKEWLEIEGRINDPQACS